MPSFSKPNYSDLFATITFEQNMRAVKMFTATSQKTFSTKRFKTKSKAECSLFFYIQILLLQVTEYFFKNVFNGSTIFREFQIFLKQLECTNNIYMFLWKITNIISGGEVHSQSLLLSNGDYQSFQMQILRVILALPTKNRKKKQVMPDQI